MYEQQMDTFNHKFSPSGYPIEDKCKICNKWTMTEEGIRSLGLEIIHSGSTKGVVYEVFLRERNKAIAHGVINEEQFLPAKLIKLATERRRREIAFNVSDIGVDQDRGGQDDKRALRAKKIDQIKIKSATEVNVGDIVFYGDTPSTAQKKRRSGTVEDKNVPSGMVKVAKKWLSVKQIWKPRDESDAMKTNLQMNILSGDENFSIAEHLAPYIGMH